ncbi:MAG: hypothetical protein KKA19_00535 [Candidatus Margulisbacteria bacterium]|nr:hypothetical protein [Candidatus Margulisiibacteriota bacterium]
MTKFEKDSSFIKLGNFSNKSPDRYENIISQAIEVNKFLANKTYVEAGINFNISRGRIYQLNKIANKIPSDFLNKFKNCHNPVILNFLSGKKLLDIASLNDPKIIHLNIADIECYLEILEKVA